MSFISRSAGHLRNTAVAAVIGIVSACGGDWVAPAEPSSFSVSQLVSDGSTDAVSIDANLHNPWGLAALPTGPMWVANNLDHSATSYEGTGLVQPLVVNLAVTGNPAGDVTGIVASNSSTDFMLTSGMVSAPARFLFASASGRLLGWASTVDADDAVTAYTDAGGAQYTGLAIASTLTGTQLYAADFHNGKIDIFNNAFTKLDGTGKFVDASLPAGYAPFNIQAVRRQNVTVLAVAYAQRDAVSGEPVAGNGKGAVNIYSTAGLLVSRLIRSGGKLNAPWGMAVAPANFGTLAGAMLVGNSGNGRINGFSLQSGAVMQALGDESGEPLSINGLRGMAFGNGASNQPPNVLYVTAGSNGGANGLYARIDLGGLSDIVAPDTVTVTEPAAAATVDGSVNLSATATDNVGVVRVMFFALSGGTNREIGTDNTAPFGLSWNTGTAANGAVALTAVAFDAFGNSTTSPVVTVTVNNPADSTPPTVAITAPAAGNVSGIVTITAAADDNLGVKSVQFFAGATPIGTDTTAPYSVQWDTTGITGAQNLTAVALDGADNTTTSDVVPVTVVISAVTLAQLQTSIFTPHCARCHDGGDDSLTNRLNLSSAATAYSSLINIASEKDPGLLRVQAGSPASSSLIRKLEGTQASGEQMPTGGPYLDTTDIDKVRSWIQAGARP